MVSDERVREVIIEDVVKREREMFARVRMVSPSQARETPEQFQQARRMILSVVSTDTLKAYHGDLLNADREGKNLIELRYGRLDNLVGCINLNPMIDEIIEIEHRWAQDLSERYPELPEGAAGKGAVFSLRCELETYSDRTLEAYYDDVMAADAAGRNLAEERFALAQLK